MKIDRLLAHHNALRRGLGQEEVRAADVLAQLSEIAPRILPYSDAVWALLDDARREGKRILFERTGHPARHRPWHLSLCHVVQTRLQDRPPQAPDSGRRPSAMCSASPRPIRPGSVRAPSPPSRRTTSASISASAAANSERSPAQAALRLVRFGPWCARRSRTGGIHGIALTKLDVLDGLDEIKVGVGYELDGKRIDRFPAAEEAQKRVVPVYESFEGWKGNHGGRTVLGAAAAQAIKYVKYLEELIECPVALLSTSPERDDTILMKDPFED